MTGLCPIPQYPDAAGNPLYSKRNMKDIEKLKELRFAYIGKSQLAMWHRPTDNQVKLLKELLGVTKVVTVQRHPAECVADIKKYCGKHGLKHRHIELEGANQALLGDKKIQ